MEIDKSMFWDISKTLSHNCLFNFITGSRGSGKTYGAKKFVINRFIKYEEQFIYLRRYKTEFDKGKNDKFFDALIRQDEFPNHDLQVKSLNYLCNDKIMGSAMALSTAKIEKSQEFPNVKWIIFDEFLIENGVYHYLPNEVMCFLDFYETIARMRDVRVLFLSNAITQTNPYYLFFDIQLPYNSNFFKRGDILLEMVNNQKYIDAKKNTRFGKIISNTKYGDYAIDNKFLNDTNTFVMKKTKNSTYFFGFIYKGEMFGVWRDYSEGKVFVSKDYDNSSKMIYSITLADHQPNTMLLKGYRKSIIFKNFIEYYKQGLVYFENINIKNIVYDVIKMTLS